MPDLHPHAGSPDDLPELLGVIPCGGQGRRLGGTDKAGLLHQGRTFLTLAAEALRDCSAIVAVGEARDDGPGLIWTTETPALGGPAAGLLAGVTAGLDPERWPTGTAPAWVAVLAVDMPLVSAETIRRLWRAKGPDGALLVDSSGRRQYLCAIYRIEALLEAAPSEVSGLAVRHLLAGLELAEIAASETEASDVDEPDDLESLTDLGPLG